MTYSQWLYEFEVCRLEEKRKGEEKLALFKAGAHYLRETLIAVFGLRPLPKTSGPTKIGEILADSEEESEAAKKAKLEVGPEEKIEPFVPLSLLIGDPQQVEAIMKVVSTEMAAEKSLEDDGFEELSRKMMDGDMEPLLTQAVGNDSLAGDSLPPGMSQEEFDNFRKILGIGIRENSDINATGGGAAISTAKVEMREASPLLQPLADLKDFQLGGPDPLAGRIREE